MRSKTFNTPLSSRTARRRVTGQGMTEYIIVVALVAIAAVAAVSFFGAAVKGQFVQLGSSLLGDADTSGVDAAKAEASLGVATKKNGSSTLGDYATGAPAATTK